MGLDWYALIIRPTAILVIVMLAMTSDLRRERRNERKARRQARRAARRQHGLITSK